MHQYGISSEVFGEVSVAARAWAATNPVAWFYDRPITLEDHQQSRMIADPLRLLDCCQESDGAVAIVVTSAERAKSLKRNPIHIAAAAQAMRPHHLGMGSMFSGNAADASETDILARQLWGRSGVSAKDVSLAIIYDHFTPAVLMQLESLGFCGPGEGAGYLADVGIGPGQGFPVNPNGGQLGEAYIHGYNGIAEAVRQLRGDSVNQAAGAETAVVTSGSHVPTSGLVLTR
jgi:acetyl-CoA acetyltransferase